MEIKKYNAGEYEVAVIGGGHAGVEAALASARLGCKTIMFTIKNINSKFIYLELNMPYNKDTDNDIIRLPLKLFKDNLYNFEEFNCLNYYKIFILLYTHSKSTYLHKYFFYIK